MNLPNSKKSTLATLLLFSLLGLGLGLLLILLDTELLTKVFFVVIGVITVLCQIPGLVTGLVSIGSTHGKLMLIFSLLSAALGMVMIFWHDTFLVVFLGIYLLVFPLIEILFSKNRLKTELPKMILGAVLLIVGPAKAIHIMFDVAGWVILALTAVYAAVMLLSLLRRTSPEKTTGGRIFVDHDGDGKIDTVYVDTTGDGRADTATRYRDKQ